MLCRECNLSAAYGCLHSVFADLLFGFLFICFLAVPGLCCGAWAHGLSSCSARASLVADVGSLVEVHRFRPQETDPDLPVSVQESLAETWIGDGLQQCWRH